MKPLTTIWPAIKLAVGGELRGVTPPKALTKIMPSETERLSP